MLHPVKFFRSEMTHLSSCRIKQHNKLTTNKDLREKHLPAVGIRWRSPQSLSYFCDLKKKCNFDAFRITFSFLFLETFEEQNCKN